MTVLRTTPPRGCTLFCILISVAGIFIAYKQVPHLHRLIISNDQWFDYLIESRAITANRIAAGNFSDEFSIVIGRAKLIGYIWPRSSINEKNNRLQNQLNYLKKYKPRKLRGFKGGGEGGEGKKGEGGGEGPMKVILRVGNFNWEIYKYGQEMFLDHKCPINRCLLTMNKSVIHTADALVITEFGRGHLAEYLPKPPHQIWISRHLESPPYNRIDVNAVKDLINWTASYRLESTLNFNYGNFYPIVWRSSSLSNSTANSPAIDYAKGKTKMAAMLVSNCNPSNNRMSYVGELKKHITVDLYGGCGDHQCPPNLPHSSWICVQWMAESYKFYLAFENSNCKDYITEKFIWNGLKNNILPVVLGGLSREDYSAVAPPHSFIHVDDFSGPQDLAAYLHYLDKNDTAYNEYFAWKGNYEMILAKFWCRVCMMLYLQEETGYVHWYTDYNKWWNGVCRGDAGYPSKIKM